jgi:hypothetical protein
MQGIVQGVCSDALEVLHMAPAKTQDYWSFW